MSIKEPGIMFDATNSWNGYNHQGKIALWYAIGEISKLIDTTISQSQNRQKLENYFLEIEYMEDFSIGQKIQGHLQYHSVHQVKNREDTTVGAYESALLGLAKHLIDDPSISAAYLHLTKPLNLNGKGLDAHIAAMAKAPSHLTSVAKEITSKRNDSDYRNIFLVSKRGRPPKLKTELLHAISIKDPSAKGLTAANLDVAFDELLKEIEARKNLLLSLTTVQLSHINLCTYLINGSYQNHCEEDQAEFLLKNIIKEFYTKLDPNSYKTNSAFVDKSYLFVLGKLDQHIVDRSLNYEAYKKGQLERQIPFIQIFDWLVSDDIDKRDESFYLYHIKESIFKKADIYCKSCSKKGSVECFECQVPICKDKLGSLNFKQLKDFLHITNPHISGPLNMDTYGDYASSTGINNPFFIGLRDIPQIFLQDHDVIAITYQDFEQLQYALTAITPYDTDDDKAIICSEIILNRNVYNLLMDYDCLISKDISVASIQDEEITLSPRFDAAKSNHITHCKDVKIVPLNTFESNLLQGEENAD